MFQQKPLWTQDQFGTRSKCYLWNPDKRGDLVNNVDIFLLAELFRSWLLIKEHKSKMAGRPYILNSALLYHFFSDYRILPTLTNTEMHCYVSQTKDFTQPLKVFSHLLNVTFEWHLPWHLGDMPGSIKAWWDQCSSWMTMTARDDIGEKELKCGPSKRRNACVSSSRRPDRTFPRVRPNFAVQSNLSHIFDH